MPIAAEKTNITHISTVKQAEGSSETREVGSSDKTGVWGLVSDVFTPSNPLKIFKKIGETAAKIPSTTNIILGAAKATVDLVKEPSKIGDKLVDSAKAIPNFINDSLTKLNIFKDFKDKFDKQLAKFQKNQPETNKQYQSRLKEEKHFLRQEEKRRRLETQYNRDKEEQKVQARINLERAQSNQVKEIAKSSAKNHKQNQKACTTPAFVKYLLKKYARFLHGTDVGALTSVDQILRVIRPRISNEEFISIMAQTGRDMSRVFAELEKHGNQHLFGIAIEKALSSGSTLSAEKFAFEIASSVAEINPDTHIQPLSSVSYDTLV